MKRLLICGPCVGEESVQWVVDQAGSIAVQLEGLGIELEWVFKNSWDKANRTLGASYRGLGLDATLEALAQVKKEFGVRVTTDVHEVWQANELRSVVDVIQIPAMLSRQTDLITAAARNASVVNIKLGTTMSLQAAAAAEMKAKAAEVWVTYRGTGFGDQLVFDPARLWQLGGYAASVVADVTHTTAGAPGLTTAYARTAAALGVDGLFIEAHPNPEEALSDSATQFRIEGLGELLESLQWAE